MHTRFKTFPNEFSQRIMQDSRRKLPRGICIATRRLQYVHVTLPSHITTIPQLYIIFCHWKNRFYMKKNSVPTSCGILAVTC